MRKTAVFLDLDGTLYDIEKGIRPATAQAIVQLKKNGHLPFICTGRCRAFIPPEALALPFTGMVAAMGAYLEYQGRCVQNLEVTTRQAREAVDILRAHGLIPVLEGPEYMYYDKDEYTVKVDSFVDLMSQQLGARWRPIAGFENILHINKISAKKQPGCTPEAACAEMAAYFTPVYHAGGLGGTTVELAPTGTTKGTGLRRLLEITGNAGLPTVVFGDSNNDMGMFEAADIKVAMGNATQRLKEAADYVAAPQDEDGISKALVHFDLI